ncbi:MAG: hypothetical protein ABSF91_15110 [Bacteroidota bacterium]
MNKPSQFIAGMSQRAMLCVALSILLPGITPLSFAQWVQTNGPADGIVSCFVATDSFLFAGSIGVWRSPDHGATWSCSNLPTPTAGASAIIQLDGYLLASGNSISRSTDNGRTWKESASGLEGMYLSPRFLVAADHVLFTGAADPGGIFRSFDHGDSWLPCDTGLADRNILAMTTCGNVLLAGTEMSGIFRSTNDGNNWFPAGVGFTDFNASAFAVWDSLVLVGSRSGGVYASVDSGATWTLVSRPSWLGISSLAIQPDPAAAGHLRLFAADQFRGLFRSTDNGSTWVPSGYGLTDSLVGPLAVVPDGNGSGGTMLMAGTFTGGAFRSTDRGGSWSRMIIPNTQVYSVGTTQTSLFAGGALRTYRSTDDGASWAQSSDRALGGFTSLGPYLLACMEGDSIARSSDDGQTWKLYSCSHGRSLTMRMVTVSADGSGKVFAATAYSGSDLPGGIFISSDSGREWNPITWAPPDSDAYLLAAAPGATPGTGYVFSASLVHTSMGSSLFRSSDNGATWTDVAHGFGQVWSLCVVPTWSGTYLFAGAEPNGPPEHGIWRSTNNGDTWTPVGPLEFIPWSFAVSPDGAGGSYIFATNRTGGILASNDYGETWTAVNSGLTPGIITGLTVSSHDGDFNLFAGTGSAGVWRYPLSQLMNIDTSWSGVAPGKGPVSSIVFSPRGNGSQATDVFALNAQGTLLSPGGDLFRSLDGARSWSDAGSRFNHAVTCLATIPAPGPGNTNLLAGIWGAGLARSTDNGVSWTMLPPAGPPCYDLTQTTSIAVIPDGMGSSTTVLAGHKGLYQSTDDGTTWTKTASDELSSLTISEVGGETDVFAYGKWCAHFLLSTDNGSTWSNASPGLTGLKQTSAFAAIGPNRFASAVTTHGAGLYRSTDFGTTWTTVTPASASVSALAYYGPNLFAGTSDNRILLSTDNGASWASPYAGFQSSSVSSLAILVDSMQRGTLLAGTTGGGVWRWPLPNVLNSTTIRLSAVGRYPTLPEKAAKRGSPVQTSPAPQTPGTCTTSDLSDGIVLLSWTQSHQGDFQRYRIYADLFSHPRTPVDSMTLKVADTAALITGLARDVEFHFRVSAVNLSGHENNWSNEVSAVPAAPIPIAATAGIHRTLLHWTSGAGAGVVRYRIYADTLPWPARLVDSTAGGPADTSKLVGGLVDGVTYNFRVTAVDSTGRECGWSMDCNAAPGVFRQTLIAVPGDGQAFLTWGQSDLFGIVRYRIYGGTSPGPTTIIDTTGGYADTTMLLTALTNGALYYYRITAVDSTGAESGWSNEAGALPGRFIFPLSMGWNMVGVPMTVPDCRRSALFPFAASPAFAFENGYAMKDTLVNGRGYWIKLKGSSYLSLDGSPRLTDTVEVREGWNIIGSISTSFPVTQITSDPGGITTSQFYGYMHGYVISDTIQPGRGYWVKTDRSGKLILSAAAGMTKASNRIRIVASNETPPNASRAARGNPQSATGNPRSLCSGPELSEPVQPDNRFRISDCQFRICIAEGLRHSRQRGGYPCE